MSLLRLIRKHLFWVLVLDALCFGCLEAVLQYREEQYVESVARRVVRNAGATDPRTQVKALRDYLRRDIRFHGAPYFDRPYFRASAAQTLRSGLGYCGEVTRTFICMADSLGIRAQRIILSGRKHHVLAEAQLGPGDWVLVDCQNPPEVKHLDRLERVMLWPEYGDFYTINLRRLGLTWLVTRVKLQVGWVTYLAENPHALAAALWFLLGGGLVAAKGGRWLFRRWLLRRGWVHQSSLAPAGVSVATKARSGGQA
jgi:hypothetical protein